MTNVERKSADFSYRPPEVIENGRSLTRDNKIVPSTYVEPIKTISPGFGERFSRFEKEMDYKHEARLSI